MTREQVETEMAQYRTIFTVVRLLDAAQVGGEESVNSFCSCYSYWGKNTPCRNCISRQVLEDHRQRTKLEYMGSEVFQVTAVYREVDGVPCVMELIQKLDGETLIDPENGERLIDSIASYHTKLYHDALTDSYNRLYFEDALKDKTDPAGVAVLDQDDFKLINDTYGHQAGDIALRTCVDVVRACIRKSDVLIRYGGDEFLLVLPGIERAAFLAKLDRIREQLHTASVPGYSRLQLSASIGGVITQPGETVEQAVSRADKLMYQAKNRKNMVVTEDNARDGALSAAGRESQTRQSILIVDDSEMNRAILAEILGSDYNILEAANGRECLAMLEQYDTGIALILLDIVMPVMDGFAVLSEMNRSHWIEDIPVIMISSEDADTVVRRAYELGVSDYVSRPFDAGVVYRRVFNTIKLYAKQRRLASLVTSQIKEKEKNTKMMISILSEVVEFRNGESGQHVLHIGTLTQRLLERLTQKTDKYDLPPETQELIVMASALHDIGKVAIDDKILNKPGRLTPEEFDLMKTHTVVGANMLGHLGRYKNEALVKTAHDICRWHHERWDGNGYPDRLKGDEIPIAAQVVALADVYDALTSERCYKHAYDHDTALRMILNGECGAFNPLLLDCLRESSEQLRTELNRSEWDRGFRQETHRLSEEILHREALPRENHSQLLLEQEKERTDFYAAQCGGIRFDYDLLAGSVTVYDYHAEPLQQKTVADFAQGRGLGFLNEQDRRKFSKAISRATPEAPDVVLPVMVQRDGKPHLHRMALHTIWSGAGVRRCVNVLGQLTDEQHRIERQTELLTATDPEEDPARFLRRLQGIFDVVRLVDPEHRKVLALDSDGILTEKPGNCHMIWNKDTRCENCISAKAYARKTILNKIEFKDEEAYFVISKYIEVGGRGCMLEMVTRLTDGRWLDMGGHRLLLDRCDGMERSAFVDPLTGAYTRRYFDKFLAGGEMHGGVAMIDVNQFKSVNDSFGHLVGDEALQTVAAAMQSCLRQTDILIRYGGDEFLLLMPQNCPDGVESVIRRVQNAVQAARVPSHPELRLSVSIGGVCNVQPLTEAIRQADARMYCNKENGEPVL